MLDTNLGVVGRSLVRVFPVTQSRDPLVSDSTTLREAFGHPFDPLTEPVRDRRVVFRGPPERRERQASAGLRLEVPFAFEGRQYFFVEFRRGDDSHGPEVLRGGPQHRGSSDIYLFYGLLLGGATGDGLLEWIEVDADQVYRADILLDELLYVVGVSEVGQDAAVDLGVQRLDPPAQYLGRARHLGDGNNLDSGFRERLCGPPGRDDLEPHPGEPPREVLDPPLVRHRDQRPPLHTSTLPRKKSATARTSSLCSTG